ncbi:MAG: hypothetical protein IPJ75_03795 [Ignavibacteriales bacterium]|nr:hypothetical protein [Ignavibacteriales bacterium]
MSISRKLFRFFKFSLQILFERTKSLVNDRYQNLALLPYEYKNDNEFLKMVDVMRHSWGKVI